jgi:hypothetical protein
LSFHRRFRKEACTPDLLGIEVTTLNWIQGAGLPQSGKLVNRLHVNPFVRGLNLEHFGKKLSLFFD